MSIDKFGRSHKMAIDKFGRSLNKTKQQSTAGYVDEAGIKQQVDRKLNDLSRNSQEQVSLDVHRKLEFAINNLKAEIKNEIKNDLTKTINIMTRFSKDSLTAVLEDRLRVQQRVNLEKIENLHKRIEQLHTQ